MTGRDVQRVGLIGTQLEARPTLRALLASELVDVAFLVSNPNASVSAAADGDDLVGLAGPTGVPVILTEDVNHRDVVAAIRSFSVDLLIVIGWNRLIRAELLAIPRRGCVGFHASLLPRNRGHAPVNWAILRGETTAGNTMMMLDPGVDTGDIVDQCEIGIGPDDSCDTIYQQVARTGAQMLVTHLPRLLDGTVPRQPQLREDRGASLPRRTPAMGIIDWDRTPRELHDWVRALTIPYPGAFSRLNNQPIMVWATRCPGLVEPPGPPGVLLNYEPDGVRIGARGGSVVVTQVSEPGQRPRPAQRWFRRAQLEPGLRFDGVPAGISRWARGESIDVAVSA